MLCVTRTACVVVAATIGIAALLNEANGAEVAAMPDKPAIAWRDAGVVAIRQGGFSPHAVQAAVPVRAVKMDAGFWLPRMEANRVAGIPKLLTLLEEHGVVDNFRRLTGKKKCDRRGPLFTDSDLYKWMEAAALVLQSTDDAALREKLDRVIEDVLAAQGADGYLNTWFVDGRAGKRFTALPTDHELYCAGHLFQAAIAHYRATGSRRLLDGATKFADYLCDTFGPDKKVQGHPGHPELEMALVELFRTTGSRKYLDLAEYYLRDNKFTGRKSVEGHAVRMMYLASGGVDYYAETGDADFMNAMRLMWDDLVNGKLYITGGVGARHGGEAFGDPFELPNRSAYAETCAGIGNMFWNWRLLLTTGESRYADLFERILYNGFLSGVSLSGSEYFYVNPLCNDGSHRRRPWYDCTCCPPNVERMIAAMPGHMFSTSDKGVHVHFYDNCRLEWKLADGTKFTLREQTRYPWDGKVTIELSPESPAAFDLCLRIPGWCGQASVSVNGQPSDAAAVPGSYCRLSRQWSKGDKVELNMAMPVIAMAADDRVAENRGSVAIMRGPVVYCLEGNDNPGVNVEQVHVAIDGQSAQPRLTATYEAGLLNGVTVLRGPASEAPAGPQKLYYPLTAAGISKLRKIDITAIPYYAWANREPSPMAVWLRLLKE